MSLLPTSFQFTNSQAQISILYKPHAFTPLKGTSAAALSELHHLAVSFPQSLRAQRAFQRDQRYGSKPNSRMVMDTDCADTLVWVCVSELLLLSCEPAQILRDQVTLQLLCLPLFLQTEEAQKTRQCLFEKHNLAGTHRAYRAVQQHLQGGIQKVVVIFLVYCFASASLPHPGALFTCSLFTASTFLGPHA